MRCNSESVKRTVVALRFSFFIAPDCRNRTIGLSLPKSKERQPRDCCSISKRCRPANNLSEHGIAIRMVMYKILVVESLPHQQAIRGRGRSNLDDLLCLCSESAMNGSSTHFPQSPVQAIGTRY